MKLRQLDIQALLYLAERWTRNSGNRLKIPSDEIQPRLSRLSARALHRAMRSLWPELNAGQLAELDCELIITYSDKAARAAGATTWSSSTAFTRRRRRLALDIPIERLRLLLSRDLALFHFTHVHAMKHEHQRIIRVQLFDKISPDDPYTARNAVLPRKPFYAILPENSPVILHNTPTDASTGLILQSFRNVISEELEPISLELDSTNALSSLKSILFVRGPNRYSNSLARWSQYAANEVDTTPLEDFEGHQALLGKPSNRNKHIKSYLKFKGHEPSSTPVNDHLYYNSLVPVNRVEFQYQAQTEAQISFTIKLKGDDVFGGMHELCDQGVIEIDKLPGWLAGENGIDSGNVIDGEFKPYSKSGLL